jgi:hypothetical protein
MRGSLLGLLIGLLLVIGCGVPQNYVPKLTKLETPTGVREVGLGDQLLVEGDLKEHTVLIVKEDIRANMCYTFIPVSTKKLERRINTNSTMNAPLRVKSKSTFLVIQLKELDTQNKLRKYAPSPYLV